VSDPFCGIFKSKKVFITGHTGFKGSWLSEWLLQLDSRVTGYSLYLPSNPCHFSLLKLQDRLNHIEGDIRNRATLSAAIEQSQPDILFHLAALPIVNQAIAFPLQAFDTNVMGTLNVLDCLRNSPSIKAAVIITSDKCYENSEWEFGYRETDRLGGKDPYSASKACAEIGFSSYFRTYLADLDQLTICTARAGNVIGGGDWAQDRLIPDCMKAWGSGATPAIRSPMATRPWQHVLEPLSGYLRLAQVLLEGKKEVNGNSFNFGPTSETNSSVSQVLQEIRKEWPEVKWETLSNERASKEAGLLKLNCDRAQHVLDWSPTLQLAETIKMTVGWYRAYYSSLGPMNHTLRQIEDYQSLARERRKVWIH
jgi:CDP-glucose 4,6-dehydratase